MRRIVPCTALVLVCALAVSLAAQRPPAFFTAARPQLLKPGTTVAVSAVIPDVKKLPPLASRDALFLVGLVFDPRKYRTPFVLPPIPIGKATFKQVNRRRPTLLVATLKFTVPRMKLPRNFRLRFFFQGVALIKDRQKKVRPLAARPVPVVLVP